MYWEDDQWLICADRGDGEEFLVTRNSDIDKIKIKIGELVVEGLMQKIIIYRHDKEYRRYVLHSSMPEEED